MMFFKTALGSPFPDHHLTLLDILPCYKDSFSPQVLGSQTDNNPDVKYQASVLVSLVGSLEKSLHLSRRHPAGGRGRLCTEAPQAP